jgi:peptide/nickel transport system permease protein
MIQESVESNSNIDLLREDYWYTRWLRKYRRQISLFVKQPTGLYALLIIVALLIIAIIPQFFTDWDPEAVNTSENLMPPCRLHPFGTDELGRDVLSRVLYGARLTLGSSVAVVFISAFIGGSLGAFAGNNPGIVDEIIMRIADGVIALPMMMVGMAISLMLGPSLEHAALALIIIWWPQYARLMRGQVLQVRERQFVVAAKSIGLSDFRILFRHIVPNCASAFIIKTTLDLGIAVLTLGGLSFIGVGAQPPTPEWGALVASGRRVIFEAWWISTFPGFAIFIFVMASNLLGDILRDILDPHLLR